MVFDSKKWHRDWYLKNRERVLQKCKERNDIRSSAKPSVLVQHHVKYKEIHGEDEVVLITQSEHVKLHHRLRKEGKCKIPVDKLSKISTAAQYRTDKSIKRRKENVKMYDYFLLEPSIFLREIITYNLKTGMVSYWYNFLSQKSPLKYIEEGKNK